MKSIIVEWMYLDVEGSTCERCNDTGREIEEVIFRLNAECEPSGVRIDLVETRLSASEIEKSNLILVNGAVLESLLPDARASSSSCSSCGELTGKEESCRTIVQSDSVHETIPQQLIREAICRVAQCC